MENDELFSGTNTSGVNAAQLNEEIVRYAKTPAEMRAAVPIKKEVVGTSGQEAAMFNCPTPKELDATNAVTVVSEALRKSYLEQKVKEAQDFDTKYSRGQGEFSVPTAEAVINQCKSNHAAFEAKNADKRPTKISTIITNEDFAKIAGALGASEAKDQRVTLSNAQLFNGAADYDPKAIAEIYKKIATPNDRAKAILGAILDPIANEKQIANSLTRLSDSNNPLTKQDNALAKLATSQLQYILADGKPLSDLGNRPAASAGKVHTQTQGKSH